MTILNPYLTFSGDAAQALKLYEEVFQTKADFTQHFSGMPAQEGVPPLSAEDKHRIMHASIQVGENSLMICDSMSSDDEDTSAKRISISIHPSSTAEADRMFALLSEAGNIQMPMAMQFWGDYFGICNDKFGINWMINVTPES